MKFSVFRTITILMLILGTFQVHPEESAAKGILNNSGMNIRQHGFITLEGEWAFYWKQFLRNEQEGKDPISVNVPGTWTDIQDLPAYGYGTYRLEIRNLVPGRIYSLYVPNMFSSFRIFHNGRELGSNGIPGRSREESVPLFRPFVCDFTAEKDHNTLTVWISNYHIRTGGIWRNLNLGTPRAIQKYFQTRMLLDMFLLGIFLFASVYHLTIFFSRKAEKAQLFFALLCVLITLRVLSTGELVLTYLIPSIPWGIIRRFEFAPFALTPLILPLFMKSLYPSETKDREIKAFMILGSITTVLFLLIPNRLADFFIIPGEIILLFVMVYNAWIILKAFYNRRVGSFLFLSAMIILVLSVLNDVLYSNQIIQTLYITPIGFILFIIIQMIMLTKRFAISCKTIENLTLNLKDINNSLSRFVPFQFLEYLKKESIMEVFLGDQVHRNMTILFADIQPFTSLSKEMTSEENFRFLNSFLSNVIPVINQENGFIDKFMGDGVLALFPEKPDHALKAAINLQHAVMDFNRNRNKAGYRKIKLGIGIHTGGIILGTIGETDRMEAAVISETVGITSGIEGMSKIFDASILISKQSYDLLENPEAYHYRNLGYLEIKGQKNKMEVLEVLDGLSQEEWERKVRTKDIFNDAVNHYISGNYAKALLGFHKVQKIDPEDRAASCYIEKCAHAPDR